MWTHAADALIHEQAMWASLQAISFEFFSSHPAMAPAYFDFFVWTPGKKTGTYRFHHVRAQAGSEQLLHPKKNNTRNLSANYLYRFSSWLISSSVKNIVSVFATAKQLLFLWFQLYSNHDYSLLNTNCVIRSVTSFTGLPRALCTSL